MEKFPAVVLEGRDKHQDLGEDGYLYPSPGQCGGFILGVRFYVR